MNILNKIGLILFVLALGIFTLSLGLDGYTFKLENLEAKSNIHQEVIAEVAQEKDIVGKRFSNNFDFVSSLKETFKEAQKRQEDRAENGIPEGVEEQNFKISKEDIKSYTFKMVKSSGDGLVSNNQLLFFLLTIGLAIVGGLIYIIPTFLKIPGIKNDHIYHRSMQKGLNIGVRGFFLGATIVGILLYGIFYMNKNWFWPAVTVAVIGLIMYLVLFRKNEKEHISKNIFCRVK